MHFIDPGISGITILKMQVFTLKGVHMKTYVWAGIGMIFAGKLQQWMGCAIASRRHQILGFDREIRGKAHIALGDADLLVNACRKTAAAHGKQHTGSGSQPGSAAQGGAAQ